MRPAVELSVLASAYNEAANLEELARRVTLTFATGHLVGELILVDDGSTDETAEAIRALERRYPAVVVGAFHARNLGIAAGWRTGLRAARGRDVCVIDSDLQYRPEDILRLWRVLRAESVDVVQGARSRDARAKDARYYLSRGFNAMLNATFGMRLHDNKSGFVVAPREVFEDLLRHRGGYHYWQSFIMVAAHARGYTYQEVDCPFEPRRRGESFLANQALRASLRSLVDLARGAWEYRLRGAPLRHQRHAAEVLRAAPAAAAATSASAHAAHPAHPARWRAYLTTFDQTHWMITRDVERHVESLRATQWLSPSALRSLQDEKLARLVRHAYRNVPYYRARMQALGLTPADVRGQRDLHKLPFLTKAHVREHQRAGILSVDHDPSQVLRIATSGSTGEPLVCFADRAQLEFRWAATLRSQEWTGYRFGDPTVRLWHQTIGMTRSQALRERADALLSNRKQIPVFEMSAARLGGMIRALTEHRPVLIDGYAEALDLLARHVAARGPLGLTPLGVMSSAQTLPRQSREIIERAFGCRVFDKYGSREFSGVAYECEAHAGHHVVSEGYIVEILVDGRPAAPGETGEIFITDLNNECMPFLRYRIGDLAVAMADEPCPCGRGLPRIGEIEGRVQSIIQGTEGRYLPGTFFAHCLKEYEHAIRHFQVVQDEPGALRLAIVKGERYSTDALKEVEATFRRHLGAGLRIDVAFVEGIELIRTGKRLACVSRVPIDFQRRAADASPPLVRGGPGAESPDGHA